MGTCIDLLENYTINNYTTCLLTAQKRTQPPVGQLRRVHGAYEMTQHPLHASARVPDPIPVRGRGVGQECDQGGQYGQVRCLRSPSFLGPEPGVDGLHWREDWESEAREMGALLARELNADLHISRPREAYEKSETMGAI